jgi:hypothetical protein
MAAYDLSFPVTAVAVFFLLVGAVVGAAVILTGHNSTLRWFVGALGVLVLVPWLAVRAFSLCLQLRTHRLEMQTEGLRTLQKVSADEIARRDYERAGHELGIELEEATDTAGAVVLPDGSSWAVHVADEATPLGSFDSRAQALDAACRYLQDRGGGELVSMDKHGRVMHRTLSSSMLTREQFLEMSESALSAGDEESGEEAVRSPDAVRPPWWRGRGRGRGRG